MPSTGGVDVSEAASTQREVLVEMLGLHARVLKRMPCFTTLLVLIAVLRMAHHVEPWLLTGWACLTIGVEVLRSRYAERVLHPTQDMDPARVHTDFVILALAAGGVVGVGIMLFLARLPVLDQALLGIVLFTLPAAGVAVSQISPHIIGAYTLSLLVPVAGSWMRLHPSQALAVGGLTAQYCIFIFLTAADGEKLLYRSVLIRHERDRLIEDLKKSHAEVSTAMRTAEEAAAARSRVLAAASHDLRQPLHSLSVYSAVLAAQPTPEVAREVGLNIEQIVRSLGWLLNGLLDLSRLSADLYRGEHRPFSMDEAVHGVCLEYRSQAQSKGLQLIEDLQPVHIVADSLAVSRIVRNLLDNAVKYTDKGTVTVRVRVRTQEERDWVVLDVLDTGKGIAQSEQQRIFEEFYQIDNPGRDRSQGVGLGLTIVQRLCELIEARIHVQSIPLQGTSFQVRFPALFGGEVSAAPQAPINLSAAFAGRRVYLIDDEHDILKSMSRLLAIWGIETLTADSVQAAEQLWAAHGRPDLLITDLRLRGAEHGAALAQRLQQRYGSCPVLIITGELASESLLDASQLGFRVMHKPIERESLERTLYEVLVTDLEGHASRQRPIAAS
jgi:signal transduction histidine kinase/ActR/RegA family two-component response regulator